MHRPAGLIAFTCMAFVSALLVSTNAVAQMSPTTRTLLFCESSTFQSLVNAPVRNVREDLAVTLNALTKFDFIMAHNKGEGCLGKPEARYYPVPLLLGYIENRWISESLGEPVEP